MTESPVEEALGLIPAETREFLAGLHGLPGDVILERIQDPRVGFRGILLKRCLGNGFGKGVVVSFGLQAITLDIIAACREEFQPLPQPVH